MLLGKNLGGFEPGAGGLGAVNRDAGGDELVGEPEGQRHLGADDDEFATLLLLREGDEPGDVVDCDGKAGGVLGDAGVAGGADHARRGG
jgi:hypothetical protein